MCITSCYIFYTRLAALKGRKTWMELEGVQKKFKRGNNTVILWHFGDMVSFLPYIEFLAHIPATSLKNFCELSEMGRIIHIPNWRLLHRCRDRNRWQHRETVATKLPLLSKVRNYNFKMDWYFITWGATTYSFLIPK